MCAIPQVRRNTIAVMLKAFDSALAETPKATA